MSAPSPWITRYLQRLPKGARVLDLACGAGRHVRLALDLGLSVTAVDKNLSSLPPWGKVERLEADLEDGSPWPLGGREFDAVVVSNYLHRPLFPALTASVAPQGCLLYETFQQGNEAYGRPSRAAFLLAPGELIQAFAVSPFRLIAYEAGYFSNPKPTVKQRIALQRR